MNHERDFASDLDNRYLTKLNITRDIDELTKNISSYFQDRVGFRKESAQMFSLLNDKLFHTISTPLYEYGKDDYIFATNQGLSFDEKYMESFVRFLEKMDQYTQNRNIDFYFMLNPTKTRIYQDFLDNGRIVKFPKENYLIKNLNNRNIRFINTEIDLLNSQYPTFNKKYDPNHWNNYGALVATNQLLEAIQLEHPDVRPNDSTDYSIYSKIESFLPESVFRIDESVNYLIHNEYHSLKHVDLANELLVDPSFHYITYTLNESAQSSKRALVFRGSYYITDSMEDKFISPAFSETLFVHNYANILNYEYYINVFQPDIVIFETVEYTLGEYFFSEYAMNQKILEKNTTSALDSSKTNVNLSIFDNEDNEIESLILNNTNNIQVIEFFIEKNLDYDSVIGFIGEARLDFFIEDIGDRLRVYASILDTQINTNQLELYFMNQLESTHYIKKIGLITD
jgi:hypothetical protein